MYVLFYHIQCLICVIKRGDGFASEDGEVTIIRAITRLTHLSDYQLAPVHFIVCTYTPKITVILLNIFLKCLGSFCVTQIIGQSQQPRVCICIECTQIFCLLFW